MGKDVKAMIISEYHPDSIISDSPMARNAFRGILEYAKSEEPEIVFFDEPSSHIKYPEIFVDSLSDYDPLSDFMDKQFDIYAGFIKNLSKSLPSSDIYLTFTDASWSNIRRITRYRVLKEISTNKSRLKDQESKISEIDKKMRRLKESDNNKKELVSLRGKKGGLTRGLYRLQDQILLRMPRMESSEYREAKKEATNDYIRKLEEKSNFNVNIIPSIVEVDVNGNLFSYWHTGETLSKTPKKNQFKHLLNVIDKGYIRGDKIPDFVLSSGHNGFACAQPIRHDEEDDYSLVASGLVMEDQEVVKSIFEGDTKYDSLQDKQGRLESVKRYFKSYPAPGISIVGRRDGHFFNDVYSMNHLAKIGSGEINLDDMDYEEIQFLSDLHLGKGATDYDLVENILKRIESKKPNIIVNVNETLQGKNYRTMPVETPRPKIRDLDKELEEIGSLEEAKRYIKRNYLNKNEPVLDNQIDMFYYYMLKPIMGVLTRSPYDVAYITTEATHIYKTVGEYGISEVGIQTQPFLIMDDILDFFEKNGKIEIKDNSIRELRKKIRAFNDDGCGWGKFSMNIGEVPYSISAEHKPGSSTPKTNVPLSGVQRRQIMNDKCDIKFEGHLHEGSFTTLPYNEEPNSICVHAKGMTTNSYDSYGKAGGWSPATIGYMELSVPKNRGGKGAYKLDMLTSDVLR